MTLKLLRSSVWVLVRNSYKSKWPSIEIFLKRRNNYHVFKFKASGGDGISLELFQTLKDDAVKVFHPICQQIWKSQQWPQDWKRSVFILIPKKGDAKECSNYRTIALISHSNKVVLKTLQARLQQYVNCEHPDVQAGFRKGRGTSEPMFPALAGGFFTTEASGKPILS